MISCVIVDDDKNIRDVFTDILELLGLKVIAKGNDGNEAVHLYSEHKPDLLFIDINMPKYDGFYAIEKIREFEPNAKIVVVTADFTQETQNKLEELGTTAVIYKPFDQLQIKRILLEEYKIKT